MSSSLNPLLPAYRAPQPPIAAPGARRSTGSRSTAGCVEIGHDGAGLRLRQRDAAAQGLARALPPRRAARRPAASISTSSRTAAIAGRNSGCPTAGRRCSAGLGGAALLARDGRRLVGLHPRPAAPARSRRAGAAMSAFTRPTPSPAGPGQRLPTEAEWEIAAEGVPARGNFADAAISPRPAAAAERRAAQMFGDVWEWTASPYIALSAASGRPRARSANTTASSCATRWCCAAALRSPPPGTCAADLSQFLPAGARAGRSAASGWRRTLMMARGALRLSRSRARRGELPRRGACRASAARPRRSLPLPLRRARLGAVRGDLRPARILPDPHRDRDPRRRMPARSRALIGPHAALIEFGSGAQPQGAHAARGARPAGRLCAGRHLARARCARRAAAVAADFPELPVIAVCADYTAAAAACRRLPAPRRKAGGVLPGLDHRQFRARGGGRIPGAAAAHCSARGGEHAGRRRSEKGRADARRRLQRRGRA